MEDDEGPANAAPAENARDIGESPSSRVVFVDSSTQGWSRRCRDSIDLKERSPVLSLEAGCGLVVAPSIPKGHVGPPGRASRARVKTGPGLFPSAQCGRAHTSGRGRTAAHRTAYPALPCRIAVNQKGGQPE